jgi:hypothetical protein
MADGVIACKRDRLYPVNGIGMDSTHIVNDAANQGFVSKSI